ESGGPSITISLASLVEGTDGYHWSVVGVAGFSTADLGGSVAVGDGSARLLAPTDRPYASAELRIAHGDHRQAVTGSVAEFEVDLGYEPTSPGYYLVLFRDERDGVVAAWGSPLPAGAFAAG